MSVLNHIQFVPELAGCVGVEREYFLWQEPSLVAADWTERGMYGEPVPAAQAFFQAMRGLDPEGRWTHELSACQAEYRTEPHRAGEGLVADLARGARQGQSVAESLGLVLRSDEVAPEHMPLDYYADDPRYAEIALMLPEEVLRAACRVASVQLHYGCADIEHAIRVHGALVRHWKELERMGDGSNGERLRLYRLMAKHWEPVVYRSVAHFEEVAEEQGFAENLKNCWQLVRISRHGTVELRMFGNTDSIARILEWVRAMLSIVKET